MVFVDLCIEISQGGHVLHQSEEARGNGGCASNRQCLSDESHSYLDDLQLYVLSTVAQIHQSENSRSIF